MRTQSRRTVFFGVVLVLSFGVGFAAVRAEGSLVEELLAHGATYFAFAAAATLTFAALGLRIGREHAALEADAALDSLTGLANRRALMRRMRSEEALSERHGSSLSILIVDLDGLKAINDGPGHLAGDDALRRVARALARTCRTEDFVARWGGDEFVVLAPCTDGRAALALAARIRKALRDSAPGITVSIGAAAAEPARWIPPSLLFHSADRALQMAKKSGRDRATLAADLDEQRGHEVKRIPHHLHNRIQGGAAR